MLSVFRIFTNVCFRSSPSSLNIWHLVHWYNNSQWNIFWPMDWCNKTKSNKIVLLKKSTDNDIQTIAWDWDKKNVYLLNSQAESQLQVGKDGCKKGVCTLHVNNEDMTVEFQHLGIQCVRKKDIDDSLKQRKDIRVDPYKQGFKHVENASSIDLNAVKLCFQVHY